MNKILIVTISLAVLLVSCKQVKETDGINSTKIVTEGKGLRNEINFGGKKYVKGLHGFSYTDSTKNSRIDIRPDHIHVQRSLRDNSANQLSFHDDGFNLLKKYNLIFENPYKFIKGKNIKRGRPFDKENFGQANHLDRAAFEKQKNYFTYAQSFSFGTTSNAVVQYSLCAYDGKNINNCLNTFRAYDKEGNQICELKDVFNEVAYPLLSNDKRYLIYVTNTNKDISSQLVIYDIKTKKTVFQESKIAYQNAGVIQDRYSDLVMIATEETAPCQQVYKLLDLKKRNLYQQCFDKKEWQDLAKQLIENDWSAKDILKNFEFEKTSF